MELGYAVHHLLGVMKPASMVTVGAVIFQGLFISAYQVIEGSEFMEFFLDQLEGSFQISLEVPRFLLTSPLSYLALGWRHPLVLVLLASFVISRGAGAFAGEQEGGYGELLFTRPVARWRILTIHFFVTLAGLFFICCGKVLATLFFLFLNQIPNAPHPLLIFQLGVFSFSLYSLMASYAYLFSVLSPVRGRAMGWAVGTTLFFYSLEVLGDFWGLLETLQPLSIFYYYQPFTILLGESDLGLNLPFLILPAILLTLLSVFLLERRDL